MGMVWEYGWLGVALLHVPGSFVDEDFVVTNFTEEVLEKKCTCFLHI